MAAWNIGMYSESVTESSKSVLLGASDSERLQGLLGSKWRVGAVFHFGEVW